MPADLRAGTSLWDARWQILSRRRLQAQVLELRLHRLTGMEHDQLLAYIRRNCLEISEYLEILGDASRLMSVVVEELAAIVERVWR